MQASAIRLDAAESSKRNGLVLSHENRQPMLDGRPIILVRQLVHWPTDAALAEDQQLDDTARR